jgi:hypothetical protein
MKLQVTVDHERQTAEASFEFESEDEEALSIEVGRDEDEAEVDGSWILWACDESWKEPIESYPVWEDAVAAFAEMVVSYIPKVPQ